MSIINFSKANCKNCYRCVRECPVKSIRVKDEQAEIVEELCIACGNCLRVCPQNAKEVKSEMEKVKNWIKNGEVTAVSMAPSFAAIFDSEKIVGALRKLGFKFIEETSEAAAIVSENYQKHYQHSEKNIKISTCCPSVNYIIQKYYPGIMGNMINIISPMALHGQMMKERYGEKTRVVFIGPCLAKKLEARETGTIDGVLTFEEVEKWFRNENMNMNEIQNEKFDNDNKVKAALYPVSGGILATIEKEQLPLYKIDGINECITILESIQIGEVKRGFIEMSMCRDSCINGPAMPEKVPNILVRKERMEEYNAIINTDNLNKENINMETIEYKNLRKINISPSETEIRKILSDIGKNSYEDELNCGACGYNSCRDKAKAVYKGMAEKYMCLPFMRHRAEMMSNTIFDNTPGLIFILNEELEIVEINPAAQRAFCADINVFSGKKIDTLIKDADIKKVVETKSNIVSKKGILENYGIVVIKSIIYLSEQNAVLVIMHDITESEKKEEELKNIKMKTIDMAQEVINKQMRVAQEIASLLGETTAETKVTLTRLKKIVQGDSGELK